ncbi:hypothetical protein [Acidovorax lacteus]|uniref:hypothetical protein n=1 Tax=Acidovorax lacteus TaxID=1924988 RepID=UPI0031E953DE
MAEVPRPVLLYLFSTHFGVESQIEAELARDPKNMAVTVDGPLPPDRYYGIPIYPWSVARRDNELTHRREEAIGAVAEAVCALPRPAQQRIVGTTILGEVHQLFPDFSAGMGFDRAYRITDYSPVSVEGFQRFLQHRFGTVQALNAAIGAQFESWQEVLPPGRDIRSDTLRRFEEHLDPYAHGIVPVSGWVFDQRQRQPTIRVLVNGQERGVSKARLGRQDVAEALPGLGTADVGWRVDLDVRTWAPGRYAVEVVLDRPGDLPLLLGVREIALVDRAQSTPPPVPPYTRQPFATDDPGVRFAVDTPKPGLAVFVNPLVPWWHAFRALQVRDHLQHFARLLDKTCLGERPVFTHQIIPFTNPGWDSTRFASEASLQPGHGMELGISLYGEAAMGASVQEWLGQQRGQPVGPGQASFFRRYGVTEFHPLRPLEAAELHGVLQGHRAEGAQFVSFFLEPAHSQAPVANWASFDRRNTQYGSDRLYTAVQGVLAARNGMQTRCEGVERRAIRPPDTLASRAGVPYSNR